MNEEYEKNLRKIQSLNNQSNAIIGKMVTKTENMSQYVPQYYIGQHLYKVKNEWMESYRKGDIQMRDCYNDNNKEIPALKDMIEQSYLSKIIFKGSPYDCGTRVTDIKYCFSVIGLDEKELSDNYIWETEEEAIAALQPTYDSKVQEIMEKRQKRKEEEIQNMEKRLAELKSENS